MKRHKVKWVEHNGKPGGKSFPTSLGRGTVESFRRQKAADPKVKSAWIEWATPPAPKRKGS